MMMRSLSILALVCALGTHAFAQQPPPPPAAGPGPGPWTTPADDTTRRGLMFGFGLGVGSLRADCDECSSTMEAGGFNAHLGWMLTPRLAVVVDIWGMAHRESFLTVFQNINTIGLKYWLGPQLWLQGGIGNANAGYYWDGIFRDYQDTTEKAPGVMLAAGYELRARGTFAIDLYFRYGTGFYGEEVNGDYVVKGHSAQFGVGFNWF